MMKSMVTLRHPKRQMWTWRRLFNPAMAVLAAMTVNSVAAKPESKTVRIVAFGDSLTAGFRLAPQDAFPAQLERALKARGHSVEVINAGVSGDTSKAGLDRFDWAVPENIDAAIVELGANDALRGLEPTRTKANLDAILLRFKARGAEVLLAGMYAPRNWGPAYVKQFDGMFAELARAHDALLYPFFLQAVALRPELNLDDGLHPNGQGVARIVQSILPLVEQLIAKVEAKRAASSRG